MKAIWNAHPIISNSSRNIIKGCKEILESFGAHMCPDWSVDVKAAHRCARQLGEQVDQFLRPLPGGRPPERDGSPLTPSVIRHDLRNAVGAVRGYLEIAQEDALEVSDTSCAAGIGELVDQLAELERQIDTLVRSEHPKLEGEAPVVFMPGAPQAVPDAASWKEFVQDRAMIKGRILVVDDNEANRNLIISRLRKDGHFVEEASNGTDALRMLQQMPYDVMLLDLMMPDMNGFEVMGYVRRDDRLRDLRIIVISGLEQQENAIRSISLGAEDYLPKPVNAILLRARISSCLARKQWRDQEQLYRMHLEAEKSKSEAMLLNTLPATVVRRLSSGEKIIADAHENVTVLFSDFCNFTSFAEKRPAKEVVEVLNRIFTEFDDLSLDLGVEKIKTIGDGYLAVAGLPIHRQDHAEIAAEMALGMIEVLESANKRFAINLGVRIGMHSGPVVAGVIGSHKFAYDVWGHTVNAASRHESYGLPQQVHVSAQTAALLNGRFNLQSRGRMQMRGIGEVETFFLHSRKEPARIPVADGFPESIRSALIVDDDANTRDFISRRMNRQGWRVSVAANGIEGKDLTARYRFDLLITDCDMPGMDGFELTRHIRRLEAGSSTRMRIIAVTGSDSSRSAQRCLDAGMDAFLRKPVAWSELGVCIDRLFEDAVPDKAGSTFCPA